MNLPNNRYLNIFSVVLILLLIPLVAMQFTQEVNWSIGDFLVMAALLFATGLAVNLVLTHAKGKSYKKFLIGAVLCVFLLVWAELAVGLFGTVIAGS